MVQEGGGLEGGDLDGDGLEGGCLDGGEYTMCHRTLPFTTTCKSYFTFWKFFRFMLYFICFEVKEVLHYFSKL